MNTQYKKGFNKGIKEAVRIIRLNNPNYFYSYKWEQVAQIIERIKRKQ